MQWDREAKWTIIVAERPIQLVENVALRMNEQEVEPGADYSGGLCGAQISQNDV